MKKIILFISLFPALYLEAKPAKESPAQSKNQIDYKYPVSYFPLSSSLGHSGRAGSDSAEYHNFNSANIVRGDIYKAVGFYSLNNNTYGGSLSNRKDIPLALTWIWDGQVHYRFLSIAGHVSKKWSIGAGVRNWTEGKDFLSFNKKIHPHIGWSFQPLDSLMIGFTGDKIHEKLIYGLGFHYSFKKILNVQADIQWEEDEWKACGGVEWVTKDSFSLRLGGTWPKTHWRAGISFLASPLILDYTWSKGHSISIRINTNT